MAVTVTLGVSTASTANAISYVSDLFTPAAGDLLIVFVTASSVSGAETTATLTDSQGIGFTRRRSEPFGANDELFCFTANGTAAASSMTVTFTCTDDAATGAVITVLRVAGAAGTFVQINGASVGAGATPTVTMSSAISSANVVLGAVGNQTTTPGITQPASWTEINENGYATPTRGMETCYRVSGQTGTTVTWGSTSSSNGAAMVIEITGVTTHEGAVDFFQENIITPYGEVPSTLLGVVNFDNSSIVNSFANVNIVSAKSFTEQFIYKPTAVTVTIGTILTTDANQASYTTSSFTPNENDLLVAIVLAAGNKEPASTLTDTQGIGFTLVRNTGVGANSSMYLFVADGLAAPTSMTVTYTGESGASGVIIYVARVGGSGDYVVQTNDQDGLKSVTPNTPTSPAVYSIGPENLLIAAVGNLSSPAGVTIPDRFTLTEGCDESFALPTRGMIVANAITNDGGDVITWNSNSATNWGTVFIELGDGPPDPNKYGYSDIHEESIVESVLNGTLDNDSQYDIESITSEIGSITMDLNQDFDEEAIIDSLAGLVIQNSQQFDEESIIETVGSLVIDSSQKFDEEIIAISSGQIQIGGEILLGSSDFLEEIQIISLGNITIDSSHQFDEEVIINSLSALVIDSNQNFNEEAQATSSAALTIPAQNNFNTEIQQDDIGSITTQNSVEYDLELQDGAVGNLIFNDSIDYTDETAIFSIGNIVYDQSIDFNDVLQIFSDGAVTSISIVSGSAELLMELDTGNSGNLVFNQYSSFDIEAVISSIQSIDIGAGLDFNQEINILPIANLAVGGIISVPVEIQYGVLPE